MQAINNSADNAMNESQIPIVRSSAVASVLSDKVYSNKHTQTESSLYDYHDETKNAKKDIYQKTIECCIVKPCGESRVRPAILVLILALALVVCGILMALAAQSFSDAKFIDEFEPARNYKDLGSSTMVAVTAVLIVTGLWGMATC